MSFQQEWDAMSLEQKEDHWTVLMAAVDPRTGRRVADGDVEYQRVCHRMRVDIETQKAAQASAPPTINGDQLAYLDRLQGAKDAAGRRLYDDMGLKGQQFRANLTHARVRVMSGQPIDLTKTAAEVAAQGVKLPEQVHAPQMSQADRVRHAEQGGKSLPPPTYFNPAQNGK
ncbi:MAG TPA: hypothetical protein VHY36_11140 [Steroidobacteraceae bacterium]|jgi:hypothetical protein|nr:hypothetical protein [Steroidobacteraceae bacterium]